MDDTEVIFHRWKELIPTMKNAELEHLDFTFRNVFPKAKNTPRLLTEIGAELSRRLVDVNRWMYSGGPHPDFPIEANAS